MAKLKKSLTHIREPIKKAWVALSIALLISCFAVAAAKWDELPQLINPLATVASASLVSLGGAAGFSSWRERLREKAEATLFEQRRLIYRKAIIDAVSSFTGGSTHDISEVRSELVVWGSDDVLARWGDWLAFIDSLTPKDPSNSPRLYRVNPGDEADRARSVISRLVLAMRNDLGSHTELSEASVIRALFNNEP